MLLKRLGYAALALAIILTLVSCFTMPYRKPASGNLELQLQDILKDRFTQDGYDHATQRIFKQGAMPPEQMLKELAGRAIWFKSAPNERHHTYVFPQKIGVAIDWSQAFLAGNHNSRFQTWGVINDPDCCVPGVTCDQKKMLYNGKSVTLADTYGWEYCAGDEALLNSLKQNRVAEYRDPACDDPVIKAADSLAGEIRENRCELKFGTSTGVVGFRKYPNPMFNAKRWQKIGSYKTYSEQMIREGINNSIQPPFRVATACASCHAAFDPLNAPKDVNNPTWAHIKGETGNQYINISKLMANGMRESAIETQLFTHTRPGVVDTSAVPHDFINNPGTINAIINLSQRPLFSENILRWNRVNSCSGSDEKSCQRVGYKNENGAIAGYKNWQWQQQKAEVPHILKGGEDSVGYDLALQRVFVNIGMCSEQCWQNHLTNLRELDFTSRGYDETPFDIGQCRAQCAAFRANEDRTTDLISYLVSRRPTDLKDALKTVKKNTGESLVPNHPNKAFVDAKFHQFLEEKYGAGSVARGQKIYANTCASCHSSQNRNSKDNLTPTENFDLATAFTKTVTLSSGEEIREDWLGNDKSVSLGEIGTYSCRALHPNHKRGHIWDQFSSETYKRLPAAVTDRFENQITGGPGYYRNVSLLNVWAHAPFMHNNAIGPEICGQIDNARQVVRTSVEGRQIDKNGKYICDAYFDPSVMGRLALFDKSMDELLTPVLQRRKKITRIDVPVKFPLGLKDMYIEFPAGLTLNTIANFDLKTFAYDFSVAFAVLETDGLAAYTKYWHKKFNNSPRSADELAAAVKSLIDSFRTVGGLIKLGQKVKNQDVEMLKVISKYYRTCETQDDIENKGHDMGTRLSVEDKNALKAFLLTL